MKSLLTFLGNDYLIEQTIIDEAQDYNRLQYIIISKIFQKADFTILGDINQNINPYYHYKSLNDLRDLFRGDTKYLELLKTYRSSPEIIDYTNKILNLSHVNAIRRDNNKPVVIGVSTNDALGAAAKNIGTLLNYRCYYFVPMEMDNPCEKPRSLVCDFSKVLGTVECALNNVQYNPLFQ